MKFISKCANLRIVLRPGIPGEPMTGRAATPGLYVKFEDGVATVRDEETCRIMLQHSGFNSDFVAADEVIGDPYAATRQPSEPEHTLQEIQYGRVAKSVNAGPKLQMNEETKKLIAQMAIDAAKEIAKDLVPRMARDLANEILAAEKAKQAEVVKAPAKKMGRPPKVKLPLETTTPSSSEEKCPAKESI